MRRKTVLFLCLLTSMAGILSGCGGNKTGETNVTLETLAEDSSGSPTITSDAGTIQFKGTTSKDEVYDFGYKASDYISLGDYSNIKVEQTQFEEVTNDEIQSRISDIWQIIREKSSVCSGRFQMQTGSSGILSGIIMTGSNRKPLKCAEKCKISPLT